MKSVQQYAGETFIIIIVCDMFDYIAEGGKLGPISQIDIVAIIVISFVYGVSVMRLTCASDSFNWDYYEN